MVLTNCNPDMFPPLDTESQAFPGFYKNEGAQANFRRQNASFNLLASHQQQQQLAPPPPSSGVLSSNGYYGFHQIQQTQQVQLPPPQSEEAMCVDETTISEKRKRADEMTSPNEAKRCRFNPSELSEVFF